MSARRLWRARATTAGTAPSPGSTPVYFVLERDTVASAEADAAVAADAASACSVSSAQMGCSTDASLGRAQRRLTRLGLKRGQFRGGARRQVPQGLGRRLRRWRRRRRWQAEQRPTPRSDCRPQPVHRRQHLEQAAGRLCPVGRLPRHRGCAVCRRDARQHFAQLQRRHA
eukprot:1834530-Pleurochrysis_carterae.AAC.1